MVAGAAALMVAAANLAGKGRRRGCLRSKILPSTSLSLMLRALALEEGDEGEGAECGQQQ